MLLVYIPEGYDANTIAWPAVTDDMYNPTKYALITGYYLITKYVIRKASIPRKDGTWG